MRDDGYASSQGNMAPAGQHRPCRFSEVERLLASAQRTISMPCSIDCSGSIFPVPAKAIVGQLQTLPQRADLR
jgi:hypothetical protein